MFTIIGRCVMRKNNVNISKVKVATTKNRLILKQLCNNAHFDFELSLFIRLFFSIFFLYQSFFSIILINKKIDWNILQFYCWTVIDTYHITDILCSRIKEIEKMYLKPTICDTYDIKCSLYLRINFTIKMHFSFALVVNKE